MSSLLHKIFQAGAFKMKAQRGNVWPMPLPYPEAHCRRKQRAVGKLQEKLAINYLVLVLDWLVMGEKLADVSRIGLGTSLTSKQWEVVRRLAPLVRTWVDHEEVDSAAMGRSAAKMETVEDAIGALEDALIQPARELRSYLGKTTSGPQSEWGQHGHPGLVVGEVSTRIEHVAKDVEPHRYHFHGRPSFDAQKFLDEENRAKYLCPFEFAKQVGADDPALPQVKVRGSRQNRMKLLEKLDSGGRLKLLPASKVAGGFENGLFSIPKDAEKDRMVLDARRPNFREEAEKRWIQTLGSVGQLLHVFLETEEVLLLHAEDLKDFYHCFRVSGQRTARNSLKMMVTPNQVSHLACFEEKMKEERLLVPCLATMAMGDLNAVAFGQTSHLAVILRTGQLRLTDFLGLRMRPSREKVRAGLMIDDFVIFETIEKRAWEKLQGGPSPGAKIVQEVRGAYEAAGLPRHPGKAVEQSLEGECWGMQIDGGEGVVRPCLKRVIPLANVILQLVQLGKSTVGAVAFGQTSHLAVILRTGQLRLTDFLGLRMRPSREKVRAGLMIDDFVIFETIEKRAWEKLQGGPSPGAKIVQEVRGAYEAAGLPRHPGKAVEQSLEGECWGMQIDGGEGVVRPCLKRVIPLANVILQLVQLGKSTVGLLELVAGALVSVFQVRRRLMSCLHEIYAAQRGRERQMVVEL